MHDRLRQFLDEQGGVARRDELLSVVGRGSINLSLRQGELGHPHFCTFVDPGSAAEPLVVHHAALAYANGAAALSHTTALEVWRLSVPSTGLVHLMTGRHHHFRGGPGVVVHRRDDFKCEAPYVVMRSGLPVTRLEQSIVDSWPLLDGDAKRAPAIEAVAQRMTTPARLLEVLEDYPRLAGRRYFKQLVDLLAAGCRSQLEIWGYKEIFSGPEFVSLKWQQPVRLGQRTIYLDAYDPVTGVNFELDGAKHHASARDRERDLRRDAALQALGLLVVRLTHDWMLHDPLEVRRSALAIMAARR